MAEVLRGIKRRLGVADLNIFGAPSKERKSNDNQPGENVTEEHSEGQTTSAGTGDRQRKRNRKDNDATRSARWKTVAIDLVMCDRMLRRALSKRQQVRDRIDDTDRRIATYKKCLERLMQREYSAANGYRVRILREEFQDAKERLQELEARHDEVDEEQGGYRKTRLGMANLLITHIVTEESDTSEFLDSFTSEVLGAYTALVHVLERHGEEKSQESETLERINVLESRIDRLVTQLALDRQLCSATSQDEAVCDKRVARCEGILRQLRCQATYHDERLYKLVHNRMESMDTLCEALDDMLCEDGSIAPFLDDEADQAGSGSGSRGLDLENLLSDSDQSYNVRLVANERDSQNPYGKGLTHDDLRDRLLQGSNFSSIERHERAKDTARVDVVEAYRRHEQLVDTYERDLYLYNRTGRNGRKRSTFDRSHLRSRMEWSGRIVAAEKALQEAREALAKLGVPPSTDAESKFPDRPDDGYAESYEEDRKRNVDRRKLEKWLDEMDETVPPQERETRRPFQIDFRSETQRHRGVWVGESISCVAEDFQERKIQEFERIRGWEEEYRSKRRDL